MVRFQEYCEQVYWICTKQKPTLNCSRVGDLVFVFCVDGNVTYLGVWSPPYE